MRQPSSLVTVQLQAMHSPESASAVLARLRW